MTGADVPAAAQEAMLAALQARYVCMKPITTAGGEMPCGRRTDHPGGCQVIASAEEWEHPLRAAAAERERIAELAFEVIATYIDEHGRRVRFADLLRQGGGGDG